MLGARATANEASRAAFPAARFAATGRCPPDRLRHPICESASPRRRTMNHPYRPDFPDGTPRESDAPCACFDCRARAALARARMGRVLAVALATGVVGANVAATLVSWSSARENTKAVASMDATLSEIVRRLPRLEAAAHAASPTPPVAAPP